MIKYNEIKNVEIELSSYCNASCPLCPRNLFGHNRDLGYTKKHLTLDEIKKIFSPAFLSQLDFVKFEGNFGDPLANPEILEIIDYINRPVKIVTNGFFRDKDFWAQLATRSTEVEFGIDGANQDIHQRYRRGTQLDKILANAKAYIRNGGKATWKMIKFDFNESQIDLCKMIAKNLGFVDFKLIDHGRNTGPVFDQDGKLVDVIGDFTGSTDFEHYNNLVESGEMLQEDIDAVHCNSIECFALEQKSIYVSSEGHVYPCCYMGFSPGNYGKGRWHQPVNQQLLPLIKQNNALEHSLEDCVKWFTGITLNPGDLIVCDTSCGHNLL